MSAGRLAAMVILAFCTGLFQETPVVARACVASVRSSMALPGRVDSLAAASAGGVAVAEVGARGSTIMYLPHDTLEVVTLTGNGSAHAISTPQYSTAPGLARSAQSKLLYALAGSTLYTINGADGRLLRRQVLSLLPVGWPAAIAAGPGRDLYVVGQIANTEAAQLFAFDAAPDFSVHVRWRVALGYTHAGIWIGQAGRDVLAVYLPDQHDLSGTISLLDTATGAQRASYTAPMPPMAADPDIDRLYFSGAGHIEARSLSTGSLAASVDGDPPMAVSDMDKVAFVRAGRIVLAEGKSLQPTKTVLFPEGLAPTALAWHGSNLLVGNAHGIVRLSLGGCT